MKSYASNSESVLVLISKNKKSMLVFFKVQIMKFQRIIAFLSDATTSQTRDKIHLII